MKRMVTLKEASEVTGLSKGELTKGANIGRYPYIRVGMGRGKFMFDIDLLWEAIHKMALQNSSPNADVENVLRFGSIRKIAE